MGDSQYKKGCMNRHTSKSGQVPPKCCVLGAQGTNMHLSDSIGNDDEDDKETSTLS